MAKTPPAAADRRRGWHHVAQLVGQAPALRRATTAFRDEPSSIMTLDPLEAALRGEVSIGVSPVDESAIARPGLELRLGMTALDTGDMRYVTEHGTVVEADAVTVREAAGTPGVIEGIMTSSSVPMLFPPRRIGDAVYCDGGILQNIPLEAAVRLGAEDIVAVLACPLDYPPDPVDYGKANFIEVYMRAVAMIGFMDQQRTNLMVPLNPGGRLRVVAPTVDIVGPFEVAQGLMLIDMEYGWMRAAEVLADIDEQRCAQMQQISDAIAVARERAWYIEERMLIGPADNELIAVWRRAKDQVRQHRDEWAAYGFPTPAWSHTWDTGWEVHADPIPDALASLRTHG